MPADPSIERALEAGARDAGEHDWFVPNIPSITYECCRKCGFARRLDGKNKPCRGVVHVTLRGDE